MCRIFLLIAPCTRSHLVSSPSASIHLSQCWTACRAESSWADAGGWTQILQCYQRKVLRVSEQLNASPWAKLQSCHASPWGFNTHLTAASTTAVCRPPRIALQKSMITCTGGDFFSYKMSTLLFNSFRSPSFFPTHCSVCLITQNAQNRKTHNVCIFFFKRDFGCNFFRLVIPTPPCYTLCDAILYKTSSWRLEIHLNFNCNWNSLQLRC